MAHRLGPERTHRAAHLLRAVRSRTPRSTSSTRPAGSWFPRPCTCRRGSSSSPRWSTPCCSARGPRSPAWCGPSCHPAWTWTRSSSANGVAGVILSGPDPGPLSATTTRLMLGQLAWTLRQDPSVSTFTLTIAGRTITDSTGASKFSVNGSAFNDYDPADGARQLAGLRPAPGASGLRAGHQPDQCERAVRHEADRDRAVRGQPGQHAARGGDADVAARGWHRAGLERARDGRRRPRSAATAWDFADRLWEIRNDPEQGAAVLYVVKGHQHTAPGTRDHRRGRPAVHRLPRRLADHRRPARGRA